jgi:RNA polymerase sigma-70 factor (ECF subfamily)
MALAATARVLDALQTDGEVVRRVVAGERPLFEVLMRRYNQRTYRVVRSIVRSEADAEDVMQQTWLQAWRRLPQLEDPDAVAGWLARIAANEALGRVRRHEPTEPLGEDDRLEAHGAADPERQAAARQQARAVEAAVDRLPDAQRQAFMLRTVEGLDTGEAAAVLRVSPGALKLRLHRAHLALRAELGDAVEAAPSAYRFEAPRCDPMVAWVMARIAEEE